MVPSQKQEMDMNNELSLNDLDAVCGGDHIMGPGHQDHSGNENGGGAWWQFVGGVVSGVAAGVGAVAGAAGSIPVPA
jgi:Bacteriocin class II with double-glycine leader peptide